MNPSIELRIRTLQRAMTEVVIPALDAGDALAQEQARLVVGHLHALAQQHGIATRTEARESAELRALARALSPAADGGPRTRAAAAEIAALAADADDAVVAAALDRLITAASADGSADFRARVRVAVLAHTKTSATRNQNFFAAMGFGGDPALLEGEP